MIHSLHDRNAHTWFQFYLCTSRNDLNFSIDMYGNIAFFIDFFIRKGIIYTDQNISAASVDDVFHLIPVEMIQCILSFFQIKEFLCIRFLIFIFHFNISVTNSKQGKSIFIKISHAVVGNIPSKHVITDFIKLMAFCFPFFRSEICKFRKIILMICNHFFQFF